MSDEEEKQGAEQPNVEEEKQQIEKEAGELYEAELPPTPQDIEMPPVEPPKEEGGE